MRTRVVTDHFKGLIEDYLRQKGIGLHRSFRCLSPDHEDRHPSMSYDPGRKNVHCFACGATYDLFDLVGLDYGIDDFLSQVEKVCDLFDLAVPRSAPVVYIEDAGNVLAERDNLSAALDKLRRASDGSRDFFYSRGISNESCDRYRLFQAEGRAYFPVWEAGACQGWCARSLHPDIRPKYKNSPGPLGIWNGDRLGQGGEGRQLFVTEGIVDAICLEQMGRPALALCGSQNTKKLLRAVEAHREIAAHWRFVACGDPDPAGARMNAALVEGLKGMGLEASVLPLEPADGDVGSLYITDSGRLEALLEGSASRSEPPDYDVASAAACVDALFEECRRRGSRGGLATGFPKLDQLLGGGLHPGLYVLGAISSLGKTSLALQVADHVAERGRDVLFFSLEQSRSELVAKSLSRVSAQLDGGDHRRAVTARQILDGTGFEDSIQLLRRSGERYRRAAARLFIREGLADIGVGDIRQAVEEHIARRGEAPFVVVDYLQILRPENPRATDKQNTDRAVIGLKRISRDFDIPVLAVSSFNRENYRAPVSMEAFKESGAVEYSSDVLLGMQLQGTGSKDFDVNGEKSRDPRRIELVVLKNRNGVPYGKVGLKYRAQYNLFTS